MKEYRLSLNEAKIPAELKESSWYTKKPNEVAIVLLLAQVSPKISVDPLDKMAQLDSRIVLVLPGANFQTPTGDIFMVMPVGTSRIGQNQS